MNTALGARSSEGQEEADVRSELHHHLQGSLTIKQQVRVLLGYL